MLKKQLLRLLPEPLKRPMRSVLRPGDKVKNAATGTIDGIKILVKEPFQKK